MVIKMKELGRKYVFNRKGGRSIIERPPIFSPDGESVVLIVENKLRVYNIQTGDCTRILESENSDINTLIGAEFPEDDEANLYGCSECGFVIIWTWEQGERVSLLREIKLSTNEDMIIKSFHVINRNECFVTGKMHHDDRLYLRIYNMESGELVRSFDRPKLRYNAMTSVAVGRCNGEQFVAVAYGTDKLHIQHLVQLHMHHYIQNYNNIRIMSVAAHKKDGVLAITDALGAVTVIRGNLFYHKNVARETMHWHFLPVFAVCFSIQGSYLYSGGMEKVCVKWTLGNLAHKRNEKQFIPRLPGIIRFVVASKTHVAITLSNNSVVIADGQMRVTSTVCECGGLAARASGPPPALHRPLAALLTPARAGHLQLFSTTTNKLLYNIDITEMNSLPAERYNLRPEETEIACFALSADGSWLVTSEYRDDGINYPEERLKFWMFMQSATSKPFSLNTCVNLSHGGCRVICVVLDNKGQFCVSSGTDQKFRIWKRHKISNSNSSWECLSVCYYSSGAAQFYSHDVLNNFKNQNHAKIVRGEKYPYLRETTGKDILEEIFNMHQRRALEEPDAGSVGSNENEMGGVDISSDGSLIAAWFGSKLSLWDTHLCTLRTTLSHPAFRPKGIHVKFGNGDAAPYVVCTSAMCVGVWSLLSLSVRWLVQLKASCLAADPFSNKMALATHDNDVYVFSPHDPNPVVSKRRVLPPRSGVITHTCFGSPTDDDFKIYFTRNNCEVYCLEPETHEENAVECVRRREAATQFGALMAEQRVSDVRLPAAPDSAIPSHRPDAALTHILSGAPHMMPPVSLLETEFLEQLSASTIKESTDLVLEENSVKEESAASDTEDDMDDFVYKASVSLKTSQLWCQSLDTVKTKRLKRIINEPMLKAETTASMFNIIY